MATNRIRIILMLLVAVSLVAVFEFSPASAAIQATTVTPTTAKTAVPAQATTTITPTVAAPTATKTTAPVATATKTSVPAATATKTSVPVATATKTSVPVATATKVITNVVATATVTPTKAIVATATVTPTKVITATPTKVVTATPTRTPTVVRRSPRAGTVSTLSTAFVLQNMDPSNTATINATFYDVTGTAVSAISKTASPYRNVTVDQRSAGGGLDAYSSFQGSVVVSSTTQLAAVVNEYSGSAASLGVDFRSDSYNGWASTAAATTVYLPQLLKNVLDGLTNTTYNSTIAIQNTSASASASVTITYKQSGSTYTHPGITIPPGTSVIIDMASEAALSGVPVFNSSATVTANQPIAALVHHNAPGYLSIYSGFTSANSANTLYMPQLLKGINDVGTGLTWGTGLLAMTVDGTSANFTITYYSNTGGVLSDSKSGAMVAFDQRNDAALSGWSQLYGSAVLTADKAIVAMVNTVCNYSVARGLQGVTWRAFTSSGGGTTAFLPYLADYALDAGTGVQWGTGVLGRVMNSTNTTVTITYYLADGTTQTESKAVTPATNPMFDFDQRNNAKIPNGQIVSAVITTSPAVPISVMVNTVAPSTVLGDAYMNYAGVMQ